MDMSDDRARILAQLDRIAPELTTIRRHLHAHPELSGAEFATTRFLRDRLDLEGLDLRIPKSGRGLVVEPLDSEQGSGPLIALRGDIDALPILEVDDGRPYRSIIDGQMHACGHDAHTTMALGAVLALHAVHRDLVDPPRWRAIFQPAEEISQGARDMVEAGAIDGVAAILALHVDPSRPVGAIGHRAGVMTAYCQELQIDIQGRGGHAARPHEAVDPVHVAAILLTQAYQLVPRAIDARHAVVLTFGVLQAGQTANVIPDSASLRGTLRTFCPDARDRLLERLEALTRGVAESTDAEVRLTLKTRTDAVRNDPTLTETWIASARNLPEIDAIQPITEPSLGAEDFAAYLGSCPGALLRLGAAPPGSSPAPPLHSPHFDIDEAALMLGSRLLIAGTLAAHRLMNV